MHEGVVPQNDALVFLLFVPRFFVAWDFSGARTENNAKIWADTAAAKRKFRPSTGRGARAARAQSKLDSRPPAKEGIFCRLAFRQPTRIAAGD